MINLDMRMKLFNQFSENGVLTFAQFEKIAAIYEASDAARTSAINSTLEEYNAALANKFTDGGYHTEGYCPKSKDGSDKDISPAFIFGDVEFIKKHSQAPIESVNQSESLNTLKAKLKEKLNNGGSFKEYATSLDKLIEIKRIHRAEPSSADYAEKINDHIKKRIGAPC